MLGTSPLGWSAAVMAAVTVRIDFKDFLSFLLAVAFVIVLGLVMGGWSASRSGAAAPWPRRSSAR